MNSTGMADATLGVALAADKGFFEFIHTFGAATALGGTRKRPAWPRRGNAVWC
jgi:hypothetical protein